MASSVTRSGRHVFLEPVISGRQQVFDQVRCASGYDNLPCKYIAERYRAYAKCQQQYTYVPARGRTSIGGPVRTYDVAVPSGCKCRLVGHESHDG